MPSSKHFSDHRGERTRRLHRTDVDLRVGVSISVAPCQRLTWVAVSACSSLPGGHRACKGCDRPRRDGQLRQIDAAKLPFKMAWGCITLELSRGRRPSAGACG